MQKLHYIGIIMQTFIQDPHNSNRIRYINYNYISGRQVNSDILILYRHGVNSGAGCLVSLWVKYVADNNGKNNRLLSCQKK
jgi:hypothetical protein